MVSGVDTGRIFECLDRFDIVTCANRFLHPFILVPTSNPYPWYIVPFIEQNSMNLNPSSEFELLRLFRRVSSFSCVKTRLVLTRQAPQVLASNCETPETNVSPSAFNVLYLIFQFIPRTSRPLFESQLNP